MHTLAKNSDNRFRLRDEIRNRVEKITFEFVAPDYEPSADPYFSVKLKDGSSYDIFSKDTVRFWTKDEVASN